MYTQKLQYPTDVSLLFTKYLLGLVEVGAAGLERVHAVSPHPAPPHPHRVHPSLVIFQKLDEVVFVVVELDVRLPVEKQLYVTTRRVITPLCAMPRHITTLCCDSTCNNTSLLR